jgi:hypothetical protein
MNLEVGLEITQTGCNLAQRHTYVTHGFILASRLKPFSRFDRFFEEQGIAGQECVYVSFRRTCTENALNAATMARLRVAYIFALCYSLRTSSRISLFFLINILDN